MKEFVVYTLLRLVLFVASLALVIGVWGLVTDGQVHVFAAVILALLMSGIASYFILNRQREAFAQRVQARAERATTAFEERKAREDAD